MVKFVGGFSPSTNAYKSYKNHTIAREGQWRMPRAYGSVKKEVKINIREYNYGGNYANYGGFQLPSWLQWAQFGMNWINQLIPQREYTPATVQPQDNNPFAKELEDLKKEIEELKAENKKLKNKPAVTEPETEPETKVDDNFNVDVTANEEFEEKELPPETDFKKTVNFKVSKGDIWSKIVDGYKGPNGEVPNAAEKKEIIRQLRNIHFGGDQTKFFAGGEQNITENLNINGKVFSFNPENYYASKQKTNDFDNRIGSVKTGSVAASTTGGGKQRVSTGWKGVAKASWTDKEGKPHTVTSDAISGQKDEKSAKSAALNNVRNKVPEEYRGNAKFQAGAKEQ